MHSPPQLKNISICHYMNEHDGWKANIIHGADVIPTQPMKWFCPNSLLSYIATNTYYTKNVGCSFFFTWTVVILFIAIQECIPPTIKLLNTYINHVFCPDTKLRLIKMPPPPSGRRGRRSSCGAKLSTAGDGGFCSATQQWWWKKTTATAAWKEGDK